MFLYQSLYEDEIFKIVEKADRDFFFECLPGWTPEEDLDDRCRGRVETQWRRKLPNRSCTRPELYFLAWCLEKEIPFMRQWLKFGHSYDFYLPNFKTVVEIDGDYWHAINKHRFREGAARIQGRDEKFSRLARNAGYTVCRFSESRILRRQIELFDKILRVDRSEPKVYIVY